MGSSSQLWQIGTLVVEPIQKGRRQAAEIRDRAGAVRARSEEDGTIKDETGSVLLRAPLRKAKSAGDVAIDVADADGRMLGEANVDGYTIAPGRRNLKLAFRDSAGNELARLEPRDKRGEELELAAGGSTVATVKVEKVKAGLLRKSRVYTVDLIAEVPEPARPLAMAGLIRYEAVLQELERFSSSSDMDRVLD
jgi:hypothetical protein